MFFRFFILVTLVTTALLRPLAAEDLASTALSDFVYGGLSPEEEQTLTSRMSHALIASGSFNLMERSVRDNLLQTKGINQIRDCNTTQCLIDLGNNLGVSRIIGGSISRLGLSFTATVRLIEVASGRESRIVSRSFPGTLDDFSAALPLIADYLSGRINTIVLASDTTHSASSSLGEVKRIKRGLSVDGIGLRINFVKAHTIKPAGGCGIFLELGTPVDNVSLVPGIDGWLNQYQREFVIDPAYPTEKTIYTYRSFEFALDAPVRWYFTDRAKTVQGFAGAGFSFLNTNSVQFAEPTDPGTGVWDHFKPLSLGLTAHAGVGFPLAGSLRGAVTLSGRWSVPSLVKINIELPLTLKNTATTPDPQSKE